MVKQADISGDYFVEEQEFETFFAPFYQYAFVGLTNLIRQANQPQSLRNQATRLAHKARLLSLHQHNGKSSGNVRVCPFLQASQPPQPPTWVVEEDSPLLEDNDCIGGGKDGDEGGSSGGAIGVRTLSSGAKIAPTDCDATSC